MKATAEDRKTLEISVCGHDRDRYFLILSDERNLLADADEIDKPIRYVKQFPERRRIYGARSRRNEPHFFFYSFLAAITHLLFFSSKGWKSWLPYRASMENPAR